MKIGPKYKIARRLKAHVFEKTQTQKYALREEKKGRSKSFRTKTDFGVQMNEKQKARMFYCVTEKQFAKYVKQSLAKAEGVPATHLLKALEHRLDNVVWRALAMYTRIYCASIERFTSALKRGDVSDASFTDPAGDTTRAVASFCFVCFFEVTMFSI
jgi:ribosomal protein S4